MADEIFQSVLDSYYNLFKLFQAYRYKEQTFIFTQINSIRDVVQFLHGHFCNIPTSIGSTDGGFHSD